MKHFFNAFRNSYAGFLTLLRETAFRQELALICVALSFVFWRSGAQGFLKAMPWGILLLAAEALNTGIERAVDLCTSEWRKLAKESKDCASFACAAALIAFLAVCARETFFR